MDPKLLRLLIGVGIPVAATFLLRKLRKEQHEKDIEEVNLSEELRALRDRNKATQNILRDLQDNLLQLREEVYRGRNDTPPMKKNRPHRVDN